MTQSRSIPRCERDCGAANFSHQLVELDQRRRFNRSEEVRSIPIPIVVPIAVPVAVIAVVVVVVAVVLAIAAAVITVVIVITVPAVATTHCIELRVCKLVWQLHVKAPCPFMLWREVARTCRRVASPRCPCKRHRSTNVTLCRTSCYSKKSNLALR